VIERGSVNQPVRECPSWFGDARSSDARFSGSRGRDKRPQFDAMLKDAIRREFDILAV
jgi:hypothetical protein